MRIDLVSFNCLVANMEKLTHAVENEEIQEHYGYSEHKYSKGEIQELARAMRKDLNRFSKALDEYVKEL